MSRAKKAELNLKPPALPQLTPGLGRTCRNIFSLYKQIWYVPFFWTLTWYTYWILRAILFLNTPPTQVNPVNYTGAAISTTILLIAISRLEPNIGKVLLNDSSCAENNGASPAFSKVKSAQDIQEETLKPQKAQRSRIRYQSSIVSEREKLEQAPQKLMTSPSSMSAQFSSVSYSNGHCVTQEISAECLTCANLISCNHRRSESVENQAQSSENSKCPFAEKLSINRTITE